MRSCVDEAAGIPYTEDDLAEDWWGDQFDEEDDDTNWSDDEFDPGFSRDEDWD